MENNKHDSELNNSDNFSEENFLNNKDEEQRYLDKTNNWMLSFKDQNQDIVLYLKDKIKEHPHTHALIRYAIMCLWEKRPKMTPNELADFYFSKIANTRDSIFLNNLYEYLMSGIRFQLKKYQAESPSKYKIQKFENHHSFELAEFVTFLLYYKLKSFDPIEGPYIRDDSNKEFFDSYDYLPISESRFALGRELWIAGALKNVDFSIDSNDLPFATLIIGSEGKLFKAIIRSAIYYSLDEGLKMTKNNMVFIAIHGKLVKDNFDEKVILEADRFVLDIDENYYRFPKESLE